MPNCYDTPILLDDGVGTPAAPGSYVGFGRAAGGVVSTGPRVYSGDGDPSGVLTAPRGSIWLRTTNGSVQLWQNTNAGTAWQQMGSLSAGTVALTDNLANAFSFDEAANVYLRFVTTNGAERIRLDRSLDLINGVAQKDIEITDNQAAALQILAGAGGVEMLGMDTTNAAEVLSSAAPTVSLTAAAGTQLLCTDNVAQALRIGSTGLLNGFVYDSTNGAEQLVVGTPAGMKFNDNCEIQFGTPGTDFVFTPDGTDLQVTGTGRMRFADDLILAFGAVMDRQLSFNNVANRMDIIGLDVADGPTGDLRIDTGDATSTTGARVSGWVQIQSGTSAANGNNGGVSGVFVAGSGNTSVASAHTGGNSGATTLQSGDTNATFAGATGGNSGAVIVQSGNTDAGAGGGQAGASGALICQSGNCASTTGTSGTSGNANFQSGTSADAASGVVTVQSGAAQLNTGMVNILSGASTAGNSGAILVQTGLAAGGVRGNINLDARLLVLTLAGGDVDATAQATDILVIDNTDAAFRIMQAANAYFEVDTRNGAEFIVLGNQTTNPAVDFDTNGIIATGGVDFSTRLVLNEEFQQRPQLAASIANDNASKTWEVLGTNAADAGSTFHTGGGISLITAGALNDQEIAAPNTTGADNSQSPWQGTTWSTNNRLKMKANIRPVDIANVRLVCGFKITATLDNGTDADQVWVGMDSAGALGGVAGDFVVVHSAGGVDNQYATGVTVAGNTNYRIVIDEQADRTCLVYINGALVATTVALAAGVGTMKPMIGLQALVAAGRQFVVQRCACSMAYA